MCSVSLFLANAIAAIVIRQPKSFTGKVLMFGLVEEETFAGDAKKPTKGGNKEAGCDQSNRKANLPPPPDAASHTSRLDY